MRNKLLVIIITFATLLHFISTVKNKLVREVLVV